MSLTPPQFIKMLVARDRSDLVSRLRSLADEWHNEAIELETHADLTAPTLGACAAQLREALDARS